MHITVSKWLEWFVSVFVNIIMILYIIILNNLRLLIYSYLTILFSLFTLLCRRLYTMINSCRESAATKKDIEEICANLLSSQYAR